MWRDNNPCTTTVIKPKIVNSVHSSHESLTTSAARTCHVQGSLQVHALEETELVSLKTCSKQSVLGTQKIYFYIFFKKRGKV